MDATDGRRRWLGRARVGGRYGVWIGCALLAHFAFLCWLKMERGNEEEVLWVSHASLAVAGMGFVIGSELLVSTALVCVMGLHTIWLADFASLVVTGRSALGGTAYLAEADALTWIGTAHHFYLVPLLLVVVLRERTFRVGALALAVGVFGFLVLVCRLVPSGSNINGAYALLPGAASAPIEWVNRMPVAVYLVIVVVGATVLLFLPAAAMLARWGSRGGWGGGDNRSGSPA